MTTHRPTLFEAASARLPLFDGLPEGAVERLATGGMGRGLLTAALRGRLRRAGFLDMGMLALATPAELTAVRKIGPVRVSAIRAHVLDELARLYPGARAAHGEDATARRRMDRLRAVPVDRLPLDMDALEHLARVGGTCADLASRRRAESVLAAGVLAQDLDRIGAELVRLLLPDPPPTGATALGYDAATERDRAELLRERDREWDEAAPGNR